jgi:hypothetical protein
MGTRRPGRTLALAFLLLALLLGAWWLFGGMRPTTGRISAAALTPAPTPADGRQIAVLTLRVRSSEAGDVSEIVMVEGVIQPGYGPNVAKRPGAWTVSLIANADEVLRFGTPDPRQVRVEGGAGDVPHTTAFEPETEFVLVIPLSDPEGTNLEATQLRLYDQPGNLIFAAGVRGGKIAPISIRQAPAGSPG